MTDGAVTNRAEMRRAFISHSSPDDGYVAELEQFVRALGYDSVFNDVRSIVPDAQFWPEIERGIAASDALIVVITRASMKSPWVAQEIAFADSLQKRVVPIWIEDCELPARFADRDVIDFRPGSRVRDRQIAASRILRHSPPILFGRETWLDALDAAWADRNLNLYTLVAWGGVGKTSLVAHWVAERFMKVGWRDVERYFDWSFYSQGSGESRQTSADLFISEALKFFGDPDPTVGGGWERGERLAKLVRQHRTLLVLDGIEPLQYPPTDKAGMAGRLKDPALEALVQSLAADNPGLCVITTREHLTDVEALPTTEEQKLDCLPKEAAVGLLRHLRIVGTDEELEAAWKDAGGHALTLQLLGRFIVDAYPDRDIRHYKQVHFVEADEVRSKGRSALKVMVAYEKWFESAGPERQRELAILRLTGLFDRPIAADCLEALRAEPVMARLTDGLVGLKETQWNLALSRLVEIDLLSRSGAGREAAIDAHPLVREYFAEQLANQSPDAFREAHSRLFDHLCKTTPYRPDELPGLAPLYQAVVHGCLAGRQQEACDHVYFDRILRGGGSKGFYSIKQLGAFGATLGAVAAFFDEPWTRVSPNLGGPDRGWMLGQAAVCLRALGRLTEAIEPMRIEVDGTIRKKEWEHASTGSVNLAQLELALGQLDQAVVDAQRAFEFADLSKVESLRVVMRAAAAGTLHQAGRRKEAEALFAEAERMQKELSPAEPLLYSLQGFHIVDLILAPAERTAWQQVLRET
ncbi:MAG: toll/interleukin-1 receptor domain-containing protein, partial [Planctomycetia bacterium]|nr:toll/interleukin-1 receptor domain-containing protein [Planctomycetia bacterium]